MADIIAWVSEKCNRELGDFYFSVLLKWQTWDCPWRRMCYNARMKWMLHSFWALAPMLLLARPPVPAALPPVAHADTETVTNVPFTASLDAVVIRFR